MAIFNRTRPVVKPTRKAARDIRPFGEGVYPDRTRRSGHTLADEAWAAYELNKDTKDYEVIPPPISGGAPVMSRWDQMAGESLAVSRHERGLS
jgi:hypothetical protein